MTRLADGIWWHIDGMPTPDEWQALAGVIAGVAAVVALSIAWFQLRGLRESNDQLRNSNDLLTVSNEAVAWEQREATRPRLSVSISADFLDINGSAALFLKGYITIVVSSVGGQTARAISLRSDREFQRAGKYVPAPYAQLTPLTEIERVFSGEPVFDALDPGTSVVYLLDIVPKVFEAESVTKRYKISATYFGSNPTSPFHDTFDVDFSFWEMASQRMSAEQQISGAINGQTRLLEDRLPRLPLASVDSPSDRPAVRWLKNDKRRRPPRQLR